MGDRWISLLLCRKSVVKVNYLFQISRDWLIRYHFLSLSALAIYIVIWYTEESIWLVVFLHVECDMDNRGKPRALYPCGRRSISDFCILFLSFFCWWYQASFQIQILNRKTGYPFGKTVYSYLEESVWLLAKWITGFKILGNIKVNMNYHQLMCNKIKGKFQCEI